MGFERAHLLADRRMADIERRAGGGEAAMFGQGGEGAERVERGEATPVHLKARLSCWNFS